MEIFLLGIVSVLAIAAWLDGHPSTQRTVVARRRHTLNQVTPTLKPQRDQWNRICIVVNDEFNQP